MRKKGPSFWGGVKYAFSPDLGARFRQLGLRLGSFAHFLALIFYSCRLIPPGHPVLQRSNIGYFGFSDVIATAASNLEIKRQNTDQIIMFGAVVLSMVLMVANGLAIAAFTVFDVGNAFAQAAPVGTDTAAAAGAAATATSMFAAPHASTDLALLFLDRVFGADSVTFFTAERADGLDLGSPAIKNAIYGMLSLYSTAMMVVAVIIVLYYAFTVVGESAMTGQPFGKRFNSFWAPIRLVVGLGLLVPLAGGLNAAQYMTLYVAKMGSGFASYAWGGFVDQLAETNLISNYIAYPNVTPLVYTIVRFETCMAVANKYNSTTGVQMNPEDVTDANGNVVGRSLRWDKMAAESMGGALNQGFQAVTGAPVTNTVRRLLWTGAPTNVKAACGELFIPKGLSTITQSSDSANQNQATGNANSASRAPRIQSLLGSEEVKQAALAMSNTYGEMVMEIIQGVRGPIQAAVNSEAQLSVEPGEWQDSPQYDQLAGVSTTVANAANARMRTAVNTFKQTYESTLRSQISQRISALNQNGWMGAGMFYTQIADLNGGLMHAVRNAYPRMTSDVVAIPTTQQMEQADDENLWFGGWLGRSRVEGAAWANETMDAMGKSMTTIPMAFENGENIETSNARAYRQDAFTQFLLDLFGAEYIRQFRDAPQTNPLADLSMLGKNMFDKAFGWIGWIIAAIIGSSVAPLLSSIPFIGQFMGLAAGILQALAGVMIFFATTGAAVGAFLYYVVPLMPFVFFFFAVCAWILEVVEAMVGLPLWALAHLRIDGDGLSGQGAQTGYIIIFGILVRPFVILFALIIGIILYSAGMLMVKQMFGQYVSLIGAGESDAVSYLAFSMMYAVISFTLATLCFKQTDQMGNQIMRWFGGSDPRYNDGQPDPVQNMERTALGAAVLMNQGGQQLASTAKSIGDGIAGVMNNAAAGRQHQQLLGALGGRGGGGAA